MTQITSEKSEFQLDENEIVAQRRDKLRAMRQTHSGAFPNHFKRNAFAGDLHAKFGGMSKKELEGLHNH